MSDPADRTSDHDRSLLEGLFRLAVSGDTGGAEFSQLNAEVYARLQRTYVDAARGSAGPTGYNRSAA
ncbi:MAG TPA: hypothetical protein DDZ67_07545 [Xanthomonadaceae bacterium]|nr:hypothetical protein [Xanthomonadaceae bacterium]